jgi:hypothetical protein
MSFKVTDIVRHCYPGVVEPEKKHTVSVLRAAWKVVQRDPDWGIRTWGPGPGNGYRFVNFASIKSVGCDGKESGGYDGKDMVELHIARRNGDIERAAEIQTEMKAKFDAKRAAILAGNWEVIRAGS